MATIRPWRRPFLVLLIAIVTCAHAAEAPPPSDTNWLSYNHNFNGQRYVAINEINVENAANLAQVCSLKIDDIGSFHTSILHINGVLYFTTATDTLAVDSASCELRWRHHYVEHELESTTLAVNRGVAYANGRLYRGTVDARLLAIDADTGTTIWVHQVGDPQLGEFFSAAPQVYQGTVIIGTAGGDWGIRGRVMAFDQISGREVWRFYTIPHGDEPGADSWKNADSARYGGGGTWTTYTIDISADEVFVPVGNPAPDLLPDRRPGENLYTNSLVVLDAATGKMKWYHQLLSNDGQDLDLGAAPVLYYNSKGEPMVAFGGKDGYVYGVNRVTKKLIFKTQITTIKNAGVVPTLEGIDVCPGPLGGVEWNGPALDRGSNSLIVGSVDWCASLKADPKYQYRPGQINLGGTFEFIDPAKGWLHALNADTGEVRWKRETAGPHVAGITPTAGGVTFTGDLGGNFFALNTANGEPVYETSIDGGLAGGVITYMRDSKQYVAFVSGNVSRLTFGNAGSPTINIYALGGGSDPSTPANAAAATPPAEPREPTQSKPNTARIPDVAAGKSSYVAVCAACHGAKGEGGIGPTLMGLKTRMDRETIIAWIKNPSAKMPKLYPAPLDDQAVANIAAYAEGF